MIASPAYFLSVIPAKAGIQRAAVGVAEFVWTPAFAGVTRVGR
ncbi:MAG TPA: hypothetical protein VGB79_06515 [Allosphingosinicella sp.]|jgi:hypothetical protein